MKIIFEDENIVVCVKPEGVLSQSDSAGGESAVSLLSGITDGEIYPVHRLDRTTMGLMVFAKTSLAAAKLCRDIEEHNLKKKYVALVHGKPAQESGEMCDLLFFDRKKNKSFVAKKERAGVKKAVLNYRLSNLGELSCGTVSALDISLETGRTHQIRVQCASRKMPLLGDRRYGAQDEFKKIALCACELEFLHPKSREKMLFNIKNTEEFFNWIKYFNANNKADISI